MWSVGCSRCSSMTCTGSSTSCSYNIFDNIYRRVKLIVNLYSHCAFIIIWLTYERLLIQIYFSTFMLKAKKVTEPTVIDRSYLNDLFLSIQSQIQVLDKLNEDYKIKQEDHFIKSFMNVVEKMAQQAYRNIDIEVKRDQYCMELATELQFFRSSCFQLKTALQKSQKSLNSLRMEKEANEAEISSLHLNLQKKMKQNLQIKSHNKQLVRKIKQLTGKLSYSIDKSSNQKANKINQDMQFTNRVLFTQGGKRQFSPSKMKMNDQRLFTASHTPNSELINRYDATKAQTFRRRSVQKTNHISGCELLK